MVAARHLSTPLRSWLLLATLTVLLLSHALPADARSFVLSRFDVDLHVLPSGELHVTETVSPRFEGSWNGIERLIPVEYRTPQGFNYTLLLDEVTVTDDQGIPLQFESSRERHYRNFRIWIPGAQDATRTFVLKYRVRNGLKFFEAHDELYWNVTGDEWDVPIEQASARITLPANATGLRAQAFTGAYGARETAATVSTVGSQVKITMTRPLGFREGLTAVVGWDKGTVAAPTALDQTKLFLRANWPLGLPVLVFGVMYRLWWTRGRDPQLRAITVVYEPPDRLTPAEVGTLTDDSPDIRDITATLVDLAVKGHLQIREQQTEQLFGLWSNTDYVFRRSTPPESWNALAKHERLLLEALFSHGAGDEVALSSLENKFYRALPGIQDAIFDALQARKYYHQRPDRVKGGYMIGGIVLGTVLTFALAAVADRYGMAPLSFFGAGILSGLIVVGFGRLMPARTLQGTRTLEGVLGFEEFLTRVEADRFERVVKSPELFEKFLPYAMALGVEKTWARAFESIVTTAPAWYHSSDLAQFRAGRFTSRMGDMASRAGSTMTSAPRSSGGSGFGRGGSSGGGFGGGGGRGF
ncbi:DUF2207 domain-containing protein [Nitrospirales bacterium NOB]|nr:DUF2207 domain-containing protein [Nitrospirales bacterium NOB]